MKSDRSHLLDLFRCIAAVGVCAFHLRPFIFDDYPNLINPSRATQAFYYLTGFGHSSVVVFFVLSGFFVGGSVLKESPTNGFWLRYSAQRLSRLWVVLFPSLALSAVFYFLGRHGNGAGYYSGAFNPPITSLPTSGSFSASIWTLVGNCFFLQTIVTPVWLDNGPLWSLANEFWYYLLFPLFYFGYIRWRSGDWFSGGCQCVLGLVLLFLLPARLVESFPLWLLGAGLAWLMKSGKDAFFTSNLVTFAAVLALLVCLHLVRTGKAEMWGSAGIALAFACSIPGMLARVRLPDRLASISVWFSEFSYTLYVTHFSLIGFIWYEFLGAKRSSPSLSLYMLFFSLAVGVTLYAYLLSLMFESKTGLVRRFIMKQFGSAESHPKTPQVA